MCGKFTAMFSWSDVVAFTQALDGSGTDDREVTYRVVGEVPVITLDIVTGKRRAVPMRWGFPDPKDWRRPPPHPCALRDHRHHPRLRASPTSPVGRGGAKIASYIHT